MPQFKLNRVVMFVNNYDLPTERALKYCSTLNAFSLRDNNTQMYRASTTAALVVSAANPTNGVCYSATGAATACTGFEGGSAQSASLSALYCSNAANAAACGGTTPIAALPGSCGGAACEWMTVDNGLHATYNNVEPRFGSASLTDTWDPTDKLHIIGGLRYDSFTFIPQDTDTGVRDFWFNAWNDTMCYDSTNRIAGVTSLAAPVTGGTAAVTAACAAQYGPTYQQATLSPVSFNQTFTVVQPRLGLTYTLDPQNVLRVNWGKYDQPPNTAFEQYNTLQQDLPAIFAQGSLGGYNLFGYGRNAPTFPIQPEVSFNTDASWEHQFKGTDMSFKISPFYRKTQGQVEQFFLDYLSGFVSGLNVGSQTSEGVELQFQKGDFSRNGFAALLSYTYTNAFIKYANVPGTTSSLLDGVNEQIAQYNSFTSACASGSTNAACSYKGSGGATAAPCYTTAGAAVSAAACTAADIANPYWNDSPKSFLSPSGSYAPYDIFLGPPTYGSYGSFVAPHVATLVVNYKHDKWAVTPALQFSAGTKYGYPWSQEGVDPAGGCASLGTAPSTARNPYTYTGGGSAYDGTSACSYSLAIPNPATGQFDSMGAFTQPSRLTLSTQLTYDLSPRIQVVATLANLVDTCFGGTKAAWTNPVGVPASRVCAYGAPNDGYTYPTSNNYNPGTPVQPAGAYSYQPYVDTLPFNVFVDVKFKL